MKTFWSIFWRMLLATAAWWGALYLLLMYMAAAFMFGGGPSLETYICFACFPPAALLLYLLWKKCATPRPLRIAAAAMLFLCVAPGLRWLVRLPELRDFDARPHSHIGNTVESPESLLIQDDIMLKDWKPGASAKNPHLPIDYKKRRPTLWASYWNQYSMPTEEYHLYAARKYLDGTRIKTLALNDASGAVHLYRRVATPSDADIRACRKAVLSEMEAANGERTRALDLKEFKCRLLEDEHIDAAETFGNAEAFLTAAPPRYRVHIMEPVEKRFLNRMPLYRIQRMDIYDHQTGERIAWAENLQKYVGWFGPWRLAQGPGVSDFQSFLDQVFPSLSEKNRNEADGQQAPPTPAP